MKEIENKIDFVLFFDVKDGNPNGDPDAGNLPRVDAETSMGLVTDVCLKRKVRNYVEIVKERAPGYDIFIREKAVLNQLIDAAYEDESVIAASKNKGKKGKSGEEAVEAARIVMCKRYFDVRAFGAVMSTGKNAGQVRGPIQMTFGRSVDPIVIEEHTITRMAVATEEEAEKQNGGNRGMGRKATVPYGLYRVHGFISPNLASKTGFSQTDLDLFLEALKGMFDLDYSAARGLMSARKLIVFKHESKLGNAPASKLFDLVTAKRRVDVEVPRDFSDYEVTIDRESLPEGVKIEELI